MSQNCRYKEYVLSDSANVEVLRTDFAAEVKVPANHIPQVILDLSTFSTQIAQTAPYKSVLQIQIDADSVSLERDYQNKSVVTSANWASFTHTVNPFVLYKQSNEELTAKIAAISSPAAPAEINPDAAKLAEVEAEIAGIEKQLEDQRQADQAQLNITDLKSKLEDLQATMDSVDSLVVSQRSVYDKLKEYSQILGADVLAQAEIFKQEVEKLREQKLKMEAELWREQNTLLTNPDVEKPAPPKFYKFLLVPAIALILLGVGGYALTQSWLILSLGILAGLIELLIFLAINVIHADIDVNVAKNFVHTEKGALTINPELDANKLLQIQQFFINKAWLVVLKEEFKTLQEVINARLEDKNIGQVQQTKLEVEKELSQVENIILSHEGKDIAPEEYLKLRRRMDTLRIEKSKYQGKVTESSDLLSAYALAALKQWEQQPNLPLVLVDIMQNLSSEVQQEINARIDKLQSQAQIIIVSAQAS